MSRFLLSLLLIVLAGCSTPEIIDTPAATAEATEAVIAESTAPPTRTPRPTWTIIPTNTPQADTPIPPTDEPSPTSAATATAAPPPPPTSGTTAEPTRLSPTETSQPTPLPSTATPQIIASATRVLPAATLLSPTATQLPATATFMPPTITPPPATATSVPATETPVPPTLTATPIPPTAVPTVAAMTIGSLAALPEGQEVTIVGSVVNSSSFSAGFRFTVADSTGRVALVMFHNTYDDCWDKNILNVGATVVVTGEVGRFEGELQIVPQWGGGVDVTAPAYAYAQPQTVANLPNVMGQRAMIDGTVNRVDSGDQFTRIFVADETGAEVEIFLWNNIWQRVPNKDAIVAGRQIRVVGVVGEFRGTVQLSPPLPFDVVLQ